MIGNQVPKTYDVTMTYEIWESAAGERIMAQWCDGSYAVFKRLPPKRAGVKYPMPGDVVCFGSYAQLFAWRTRHGWNKVHQFCLPIKSTLAPVYERGRP